MSVTYASERGIQSKTMPYTLQEVVNVTPPAYTRPSDWLTMPTVSYPTDDKFVGLVAVFPYGKNVVGIQVTTSTGTFTVDWGDGTSPQTYASTTVAVYNYDYNSLSPTTECSRGYRQSIITVTATTGQITALNITPTIPVTSSVGWNVSTTVTSRPYLDIRLSLPNVTAMPTISGQGQPQLTLLEIFSMYGIKSTITSVANMMQYCTALQSIPVFNLPAGVTNLTYTFSSCTSLVSAPNIEGLTGSVSCLGMFQGCTALQYVPDYSFKISAANIMFSNCGSLIKAPNLDLSLCTTTASMFSNCSSLITVPNYNTGSSLTNISSMFANCFVITNAPYFNTSGVTDFSSAFRWCRSLVDIPTYDTSNVLTFNSSFANCSSLVHGVPLDTAKTTDMTSMYQYCFSLEDLPKYNTSNVTTLSTMVGQCYSLRSFPQIDTTKVANMTQTFYQCYVLESIPDLNYSNVTTLYQTFFNCSALQSIGNINSSNVANLGATFQACSSLTSLGTIDTTKVTTMALTWYQCSALPSLNFFDSSNCTNFQGTFANMTALKEIPEINTSKGTTFASFAILNTSLRKLPSTLNTSNGTATGSQFLQGCNTIPYVGNIDVGRFITTLDVSGCTSLTWCDMANITVPVTFANDRLDKDALENIFINGLTTQATAKAITISNNPGADTAVSVPSCNYSQAGTVVTLTTGTTSALSVGMYCTTGAGIITIGCTFSAGVTKIACTQHQMDVGDKISFTTTVGNITAWTVYYITNVSADGNGFNISATLGGAEITPSTTGGNTVNRMPYIVSLTSTTITMSSAFASTNSAQTLIFRKLNTRLASLKNWTITG